MRRALVLAGLLSLIAATPARAEVDEVEAYASLPDLVRAADAVVLGQVIADEPGRSFGGCGYTSATLRVDEVLAGGVGPLSPVVTLEYFGWCGPTLPRLGREIPAERGIFFLRNKGAEVRRLNPGVTEAEAEAEAGFWRLAIRAGSAIDVAGRVHVPVTDSAPFLAALEGASFGELVDAVRAAAPHAPAGSGTSENAAVTPLVAGIVLALALGGLVAAVAWKRVRSAS